LIGNLSESDRQALVALLQRSSPASAPPVEVRERAPEHVRSEAIQTPVDRDLDYAFSLLHDEQEVDDDEVDEASHGLSAAEVDEDSFATRLFSLMRDTKFIVTEAVARSLRSLKSLGHDALHLLQPSPTLHPRPLEILAKDKLDNVDR